MPRDRKWILPEQQRLGLVNAQVKDLADIFKEKLGDCARDNGVQFLAEYKYTEAYKTWAVGVANTPDNIEIVGEGLELIIRPNPQLLTPDKALDVWRWRVLVKDHTTSQTLIKPVFDLVHRFMFPDSTNEPYLVDEELGIQQSIWRLDIPEVPIIRNGRRYLF